MEHVLNYDACKQILIESLLFLKKVGSIGVDIFCKKMFWDAKTDLTEYIAAIY
jgi:hypothetical protein